MPPTPSLSVVLDINPRSFKLNRLPEPSPTISLTVTSHTTEPITIFTWPGVFNLSLSQRRTNFTCLDLTSNTWLSLGIVQVRRGAFRCEQGTSDEKYFFTLEPEVPFTFQEDFNLARRKRDDIYTLESGHQYRFGIREGEALSWWRWGRKEEVVPPAGQSTGMGEPDGSPLILHVEGPVEFVVE